MASLCSCMKSNDFASDVIGFPYDAEIVVSVKQADDGTVYLQYGKDRLYPGGAVLFERECRALASVTVYAEEVPEYGYMTYVHWIEELDRGSFGAFPSLAAASDGIDVLPGSSFTNVEDGYLTIHYKAWWGKDGVAPHSFTLVQGEDPYSLTLCHDAHGESRDEYAEGLVYFDINSLPATAGETHKLTLNWTGTDGLPKAAEFEFETRI